MTKERIAKELVKIAEELLEMDKKGWVGLHGIGMSKEEIGQNLINVTKDIRFLATLMMERGIDYTNAPDLGVDSLVEAVEKLKRVYYQE